MSAEPFIRCHNLVKIYKVADLEVVALQGMELKIQQGEILALVGPSGSGKSTLMNILGGLDRPSAGQITVGDYNLVEMPERDRVLYRRQAVGFVWQQTDRNLLPYLNAQENVELPMVFNHIRPGECRRRAQELLSMVGLEHRMTHRVTRLSGGEQQRVALAVAMANRPLLLLADEPTGQIDSEASNLIFNTMYALQKEYNTTIIVVTHDHNVAERANRVIGMRDGHAQTEILRRPGQNGALLTEEEFAILDQSGRLQLPLPYIEALKLKERVQLRLHDDHIGIFAQDSLTENHNQ